MYFANFARTKGAKDIGKRKKRSGTSKNKTVSSKSTIIKSKSNLDRVRGIELGTRSVANLGRGLNSVNNSIREARITAKYFGLRPRQTISTGQKIRSGLLSASKLGTGGLKNVNIGLSAGQKFKQIFKAAKEISK